MTEDWPVRLVVAMIWIGILLVVGIAGRYADPPLPFDPNANYVVILP